MPKRKICSMVISSLTFQRVYDTLVKKAGGKKDLPENKGEN